ncbi:iron chelate uptake ABC transporter family permease subunit [Shinella granuli]|uniref:Iron complex transport system permease protein n=1 Tax=Shinella granuli TaxID=323621 RepID=A0A4R2CXK5_SHIGR|nr:iron chelate uptake ABC transporter family permease subunit [Shinella granuli]TCN45956.1 iron complex transport system permease protein [Shinella granuli]
MRDRRLLGLAAAALAAAVAFLAIGLKGNIAFVLELRLLKLAALVQVGVAIAISTVIFQTVTGNRILTPSIMGLDALYLFGQMLMVFLLGGVGYVALDPQLKFGLEVLVLMALASALLLPMLKSRLDMGLMLLAGVVFGVLFRSLHSLLARLIDPNEFSVVQSASFANFNAVRTDLLVFAAIVTVIAAVIAWRARHVLDVVSLGPDTATGLGVGWAGTVTGLLLLVSALVAVSTALVGPVAFFGLLVAALAERIVDTRRHGVLLPAAALAGIVVLVGGQTLFQHALGNATALGVVIEFVGGLVFLLLLVLGSRK